MLTLFTLAGRDDFRYGDKPGRYDDQAGEERRRHEGDMPRGDRDRLDRDSSGGGRGERDLGRGYRDGGPKDLYRGREDRGGGGRDDQMVRDERGGGRDGDRLGVGGRDYRGPRGMDDRNDRNPALDDRVRDDRLGSREDRPRDERINRDDRGREEPGRGSVERRRRDEDGRGGGGGRGDYHYDRTAGRPDERDARKPDRRVSSAERDWSDREGRRDQEDSAKEEKDDEERRQDAKDEKQPPPAISDEWREEEEEEKNVASAMEDDGDDMEGKTAADSAQVGRGGVDVGSYD